MRKFFKLQTSGRVRSLFCAKPWDCRHPSECAATPLATIETTKVPSNDAKISTLAVAEALEFDRFGIGHYDASHFQALSTASPTALTWRHFGLVWRVAATFDLDYFAYLSVPSRLNAEPQVVATYPSSWTTHYLQNHYDRLDPVIALALSGPEPFEWGRKIDYGDRRAIPSEPPSLARLPVLSCLALGCSHSLSASATRTYSHLMSGWLSHTLARPADDDAAWIETRKVCRN
jgi:Autoinducer binding domain